MLLQNKIVSVAGFGFVSGRDFRERGNNRSFSRDVITF